MQQDTTALVNASGSLGHPKIDLGSRAVQTATTDLHRVCEQNGLTIGVAAQGG